MNFALRRRRLEIATVKLPPYSLKGREPGQWAGMLFYEVEGEEPRPDADLLLGFHGRDGTRFIVTRRGRAESSPA